MTFVWENSIATSPQWGQVYYRSVEASKVEIKVLANQYRKANLFLGSEISPSLCQPATFLSFSLARIFQDEMLRQPACCTPPPPRQEDRLGVSVAD